MNISQFQQKIQTIMVSVFITGIILGILLGAAMTYIIVGIKNQPAPSEVVSAPKSSVSKPVLSVHTQQVTQENPIKDTETYDVPLESDLIQIIDETCGLLDVSKSLIYAIIHKESSFNPKAISSMNCKGYMQLADQTYNSMEKKMSVTHPDLYTKVQDKSIYNPESNLIVGIYHIWYLRENFTIGLSSEVRDNYILTAYNRGVGGAQASRGVNYNTEYSRNVLRLKEKLETNRSF